MRVVLDGVDAEAPPASVIDGDVAAAPEVEGDVEEEGGAEGDPEPDILASEPKSKVLVADPAPILHTR